MILKIEELSLNAWPSLQTMHYDGWLLRFAEGCTRRSNSINPIYSCKENIDDKIRECERIYKSRKLPTIFKITKACHPHNLDFCLAQKGYREEATTSVRLLELNSFQGTNFADAEFSNILTPDWEIAFHRLSKTKPQFQLTHNKILSNIVPPRCFAMVRNNENEIVSCGLGVLENTYLGLFDIVTDENHRGKGIGKNLVENILKWGKENGARTSYLQVMKNNGPALKLYSKLGFKEEYSYWYRVKEIG